MYCTVQAEPGWATLASRGLPGGRLVSAVHKEKDTRLETTWTYVKPGLMTAPTKAVGGWSRLARLCPVTAARCLLGRAACISNLGAFSCEQRQRGNERIPMARQGLRDAVEWVERIEAISRRGRGGCNPLQPGCSRYRVRTSRAMDVCCADTQGTWRRPVWHPAVPAHPASGATALRGARGSTWSEGLRTNQSPSPGFNCLRCANFHVAALLSMSF